MSFFHDDLLNFSKFHDINLGFPGVLSFFQVFQVEWEPSQSYLVDKYVCPPRVPVFAVTKDQWNTVPVSGKSSKICLVEWLMEQFY